MTKKVESVATPTLTLSREKACFIVIKAREFDVKDVATNTDESSSATDDAMSSVLEDRSDDPVEEELRGFIGGLNQDEQIDLVALVWLGRGDGGLEDWDQIRAEASRAHNKRTARYLLGIPLLADYLVEGLTQCGLSCDEFEADHL
jgi:Protein of unknown function (DUF3775)